MYAASTLPYPRFLRFPEDLQRDGIVPRAASDYPRGSPDSDDVSFYEIMTPSERNAALDFYEAELEWFDWEYLSSRRSLRTSRGVVIIQTIAGKIRNLGLDVCFVAQSRAAFDLIRHLVFSEYSMLKLDAEPYIDPGEIELVFCEATLELSEMGWNGLRRSDCRYGSSLTNIVMYEGGGVFNAT